MKGVTLGAALLLLTSTSSAATDSQTVVVALETSKGRVLLELDRARAPKTVEHFVGYVNSGFYDGTIFHRVRKGFMIQGGGFTEGWELKKTGAELKNEADNGLQNLRGTVAMARKSDPHSATVQFFINTVDNKFLNHTGRDVRGWGYCVFGRVVEGMEVVDAIADSPVQRTRLSEAQPIEEVVIRSATVTDSLEMPLAKLPAVEKSTGAGDLLASRARRLSLPPTLSISVELDHENVLENRRFDAGERVTLRVTVRNDGPGPALDVAVSSNSPVVGIESNDRELGSIEPGSSVDTEISLDAPLDLDAREVAITISVSEQRGYGAQPVELRLAAAPLRRPTLEIVDLVVDDSSPRSSGDGDGIPASGERVEVAIRILNSGAGPAVRPLLSVDFSGSQGVTIRQPVVQLPGIAVGELVEGRILIELPPSYSSEALSLDFVVVDGRGSEVAQVSNNSVWRVVTKRPSLSTSFRLFDGNSSNSRGNRDGRASNGELIEVALVVANRGTLTARDVTVQVEPTWPGLQQSESRLSFGDIPPSSDSAESRFAVPIPRQTMPGGSAVTLPLDVRIVQADFSDLQSQILLPYRQLDPLLEVEAESPPVVAGQVGRFELRLSNKGSLDAERVRVELETLSDDILLLDDGGFPSQSVERPVGGLSTAAVVSAVWPVRVKSGARQGQHTLRFRVHQEGYPTLEEKIEFVVLAEASRRLTINPAEETEPLRDPGSALPATVSFIQPNNGDHISATTTLLVFEVHHVDTLAEVRVLANDRLIKPSKYRSIGTSVSRFEAVLPLDEGENRIEVVVITRRGVRTSHYLGLLRPPERGELWVAAVGISDYQDPREVDLFFAEKDAEAMDRYYAEIVGVPPERRFLLTNERATLAAIKRVLGSELPQKVRLDDTVVLFFAGHGKREQDFSSQDPDGYSRYLLPFDGYVDDLFSTALRMEDVAAIVRRLKSKRVVLLIDSCFSGGFGRREHSDSLSRSGSTDQFLDRLARSGAGRIVITASRATELALEPAELGHGVFTYSLLKGLRGEADEDNNGDIDTDEVYRFVSREVAGRTKGRQNPVLKAPELVGRIIIGRSAAGQED